MSLSKFGNWREATNDNIGVAPGLNQKTEVAPVLDPKTEEEVQNEIRPQISNILNAIENKLKTKKIPKSKGLVTDLIIRVAQAIMDQSNLGGLGSTGAVKVRNAIAKHVI
jgi:hypothetical protein